MKKDKKIILINALGIQDSGGITVLNNLLFEISDSNINFLIICNENQNINKLSSLYKSKNNLEFIFLKNIGFLQRFYYENIIFRKLIKEKNIDLVYNFSGTGQFFSNVTQLTKIHNLLFYSKKIDQIYFYKKQYLKWFKQIFIKRLLFHIMIKNIKYIEVQSLHVKDYISDFIDISNKLFFVKSDIHFFDKDFYNIKNYNFKEKITILFLVGPHFEYLHKNLEDFVKAMIQLKSRNISFEIKITLTEEQLSSSILWDNELNQNTIFLGYISQNEIKKLFNNNTLLISTSVIETLGLHVIEAIQSGIISIVPNEIYSKKVYGEDIQTYELFDYISLVNKIEEISLLNNNDIKDIILKNKKFLLNNENLKFNNIIEVFSEIVKEKNV